MTQRQIKSFIFVCIVFLSFYYFLQYVSANSPDQWTERNYYRDNQLILTETRLINELGYIVESSIHYAENVPLGSHTKYQLDENGKRICAITTCEDGRTTNNISGFIYDVDGNLVEFVWESENGNITEKYEYDNCGNETAFFLIDSEGVIITQRITQNFYDQNLLLVQSYSTEIITSEKKIIQKYYYDDSNRLIQVTMEDQDNTSLGYYEYIY